MPFLSSPGFGAGGKAPPTPYFPNGSVVPFYGATPAVMPTGWQRWSGADGVILYGRGSDTVAGTTDAGHGGSFGAYATYSIGAHTGSAFTTNYHATVSGSAGPASSSLSAGNHTHSSISYVGSSIKPATITVNFLRSTQVVFEIPENSIIFKGTTPVAAATAFKPENSGIRYLTGSETVASGTMTAGVSSQFLSGSSGTAGSHYHSGSNTRALGLTGGGFNYAPASGGSHFHAVSVTQTQSIFGVTTMLDAWQLASAMIPENQIIIMYVGSLANLKAPWFLCNGTNGTIDLTSTYPAIGTGGVHGQVYNENMTVSGQTVGTSNSNAVHSHQGSYTNYKATTSATAIHTSQAWFHDHGWSMGASAVRPAAINLHFIQYKGK